jgi:dihydroflavonol-4-reductase
MITLVTGGNGFVGGALLRHLVERGERVRALVRRGSDQRNVADLPLEIVYGDLRDRDAIRAALKGCRRIYHVAAQYALWSPSPKEMYAINVGGTVNLMEEARREGVERIVYTSTVGALGLPRDERPSDEKTPVSPDTLCGDYKKSKYQAEQEVLRLARQGVPVVIVNPSTPVGPGDVKPTPTGKMIVDFLNGKMWAYLETGLNLIDVDDVAIGHRLAMEKGKVGEKYILGNENFTLREIFRLLGDITRIRPPRFRVPLEMVLPLAYLNEWVSDHVTHRTPMIPVSAVKMARYRMFFDPSKAVKELGLSQRPVRAALERAVKWFWEHGYAKRPSTAVHE